jgi:hypothetical protein
MCSSPSSQDREGAHSGPSVLLLQASTPLRTEGARFSGPRARRALLNLSGPRVALLQDRKGALQTVSSPQDRGGALTGLWALRKQNCSFLRTEGTSFQDRELSYNTASLRTEGASLPDFFACSSNLFGFKICQAVLPPSGPRVASNYILLCMHTEFVSDLARLDPWILSQCTYVACSSFAVFATRLACFFLLASFQQHGRCPQRDGWNASFGERTSLPIAG